jgi:hypothetical protein
MNRTELKLVKSLASLAARHSLRDWRTVAKLLGVNISVPRLRSAIATVRAIEAEERAISILDLYPRRITSSKKSGKKRIDSSTLREAAPTGKVRPQRSISGDEFAKWLRIISPDRPSKTTTDQKGRSSPKSAKTRF